MNDSNVILSICTITYNHEKYIKQAIDSFLVQNVNFKYEIIICDDNSLDSTFDICKSYLEFNSDRIKLFKNEINLGPIPNLTKALNLCSGKYIAWCEGDDFWIDENKLQKQVDFLEENLEYSFSFHNAIIQWDESVKPDEIFCQPKMNSTYTIQDIIKRWFIPSASMVFRSEAIKPLPEWFPTIYNGDYCLQLLAASKGKVGYIDNIMCVYRKNPGSLSAGIGKNIENISNKQIVLLRHFDVYTNNLYTDLISIKIRKIEIYIKRNKSLFYSVFFNSYNWIKMMFK